MSQSNPYATTDDVPVVPTNVRWIVFALACATSFLLYLHRYSWNIIGPQLQLLIQRWSTLSKAVQQQIMRLVG